MSTPKSASIPKPLSEPEQKLLFVRQLRSQFQVKLFVFLAGIAFFIPFNLTIGGKLDWLYWLILLATFGISWEGCKAYQVNPAKFEQQFQQWQARQE
jgi:hypothetical protein